MIIRAKKISGEFVFVVIVLLAYLALFVLNFFLAERALLTALGLFIKIVPVLLLVFLFMFLSNYFFSPKKIVRHLGEESGARGWFLSILAGILSTGPIFLWYPLLKELKDKGMKKSLAAAFLYNRAVKIQLLPMMIFYFGISFTIILTFYMIVFSIINGFIVGKIKE